jgi:hypothetical protein
MITPLFLLGAVRICEVVSGAFQGPYSAIVKQLRGDAQSHISLPWALFSLYAATQNKCVFLFKGSVRILLRSNP